VPIYSPGLPIMMAGAKWLLGHHGVFLVVPACAVVFVFATCGVALRLGSGISPVVATWLVAMSPVVLWHTVVPMSDVPVAAVWTVAIYFLLGRPSATNAAAAGLASGLAILIRPNLVPIAGALGLHYLFAMRHAGTRLRAVNHLGLFAATAGAGAVLVAVINNYLYGSPLSSGYGALGDLFAAERIGANLRIYLSWLVEAHTPVVLLGLAAIALPARRLWPAVGDRTVFITLGVVTAGVWGIYAAWFVFEGWHFGRFLLSSWPWLMLGVGAVADAVYRTVRPAWIKAAVVLAVALVVAAEVRFARREHVFEIGRSERRYAMIARVTRDATPPNSVIIALHHSGSVRYYGERMTMDFSRMDGGSLDGVVAWLSERGIRTYATLEDWEMPEFRSRFAGASRLAAFDRAPLAVFEDPGRALVFDLTDPDAATGEPLRLKGLSPGWRAIPPGPPPTLVIGAAGRE
jgi:hypothetical protein